MIGPWLYLAESQVDAGRLADVHDLPVRAEHEDEPVQGLEQVGAQLLEGEEVRHEKI